MIWQSRSPFLQLNIDPLYDYSLQPFQLELEAYQQVIQTHRESETAIQCTECSPRPTQPYSYHRLPAWLTEHLQTTDTVQYSHRHS